MQWFLKRGRVPFLIFIGVVTAFLAFQCLGLKVDQDNRSMNADNPAQTEIEEDFREVFGENDSIVVAVSRKDLMEEDGQALVRKLVREFSSLDGVQRVASLLDTGFIVAPAQVGVMVSEDGTMTAIRLVLDDFTDDGETLANIVESVVASAKANSKDGTRIAVTGLPVQKYEVGKLVRKDQRMFAPLSMLVLGSVLFFITRRFSGLIFPLLVSVLTICWTLGLYAWAGKSLNMITSLLPPVIMTLSVATTIHIYLEWLGSTEKDRFKRIADSVRHLYKPCLFASLTTAIGFLSLLLSPTPAVRYFGIYAAVGVGIAYLLGVIGLAVGLTFIKPPEGSGKLHAPAGLDRLLTAIGNLSVDQPWKVIACTLVIGVIGVVGFQRIETDTDLLHFLGDDSQLVDDTEFIDRQLAGVSTIELFVEKSDGAAFTSTGKISEFQEALGKIEHVRHTLSIADFLPLDAIPPGFTGNEYLSKDLEKIRITVSTDTIGTKDGNTLIKRVDDLARASLGSDFLVRPVGGFYRVITESSQLVASQSRSFVIAITLILISIGIVFRSFRYTLLAIVPNVVPLMITAAVMGFSGIALSTGTVMIASVVIGIAVDDTIHYISAYRRSRNPDRGDGIKATTRSTGFVLLSTTMALSAGFWVAIFGSFQPTVYFALLTGVTMWFALVCDLLVLPAFLKLAAPRHPNHPL